MADESARHRPQHDSDYDGAWKEALREHLSELIDKYFPTEHAEIDWKRQPEWFDKELSQVLGQSGRRNREVDVLVKVRLLTGQDQWILLHLEIQTSHEEDFAARLSRYNSGLFWVFGHRVVTLVVLADLRRGWQPDEDVFRLGTFESRLKFPVCKLINRLDSDWQADHSLPVLLARAQVEALRTAGDPEARYQAKWLLVRGLYDLGYNSQQVREIFRLIDWMMHLRVDFFLDQQFRQDLDEFEEENRMPYVTSIERLALADAFLGQLEEICGSVPDGIATQIKSLRFEQLDQLGRALLRFQSLADLETWLEQNADSGDEPQ